MNRISVNQSTSEGFQVVHCSTGTLALVVMPELGAKLCSLRDVRSGREWLWRHPRIPYQRVPHGSSYIREADTGGWDECFPSVSECNYPSPPFQGALIQDHGELWSQKPSFNVIEGDDSVTLYARWHGIALRYVFERTITISADSSKLHFEYNVRNTSDAPLQWIWSAHPLIGIEPGMQLLVPPSARFHVGGTLPSNLLTQDSGLHFPMHVGKTDLTTLPDASANIAIKLWSDPLDEGWATLRATDGEFQLRWDPILSPQLGLWLNLGAWGADGGAPYYNLGLEPCIGAQDSLADAVTRYHLFETLPAHASHKWWLEVELALI